MTIGRRMGAQRLIDSINSSTRRRHAEATGNAIKIRVAHGVKINRWNARFVQLKIGK